MTSLRAHVYAALLVSVAPALIAARAWTRGVEALTLSYVVLVTAPCAYLFSGIVYNVWLHPLRHLPSPHDDWFALAHFPQLLQRPPGMIFLPWMKNVPNDGLIRLCGLLHRRLPIFVTSPEAVADVLGNHPYDFHKPAPEKTFLALVLGEGVLLTEDKVHKLQRRILQPAFHGRHVRQLVPLFWAKSQQFAQAMAHDMEPQPAEKGGTGLIELCEYASRATLDIIGKAGFGRDFNTLENSGDEVAAIFRSITDPTNKDAGLTLLVTVLCGKWMVQNLPIPGVRRIRFAAARLRTNCVQMLADRRAELAEKADESIDICSILIRSASMSDQELVDQLLTFLAAGHETTASALSWASYMVAVNPDMQARLRVEVREKLAANAGRMDAETLDSMTYLQAFCTETLRFWSTVPATARVSARDTTIAGHRIPKDTEIIIPITAINRMPEFWGPDGEEFKPDRWLAPDGASPDEVKERARLGSSSSIYHNITFLHGPRGCIGQTFAQNELKCLVAALVDRFEVRMADPAEKVEAAGLITVKPQNGLKLLLTDLREGA